MAYVRKTADEYEVQQYTAQGWECVDALGTFAEARASRRNYEANQPSYSFCVRKVRVPLAAAVRPAHA